jgi:hypothetical protein
MVTAKAANFPAREDVKRCNGKWDSIMTHPTLNRTS